MASGSPMDSPETLQRMSGDTCEFEEFLAEKHYGEGDDLSEVFANSDFSVRRYPTKVFLSRGTNQE